MNLQKVPDEFVIRDQTTFVAEEGDISFGEDHALKASATTVLAVRPDYVRGYAQIFVSPAGRSMPFGAWTVPVWENAEWLRTFPEGQALVEDAERIAELEAIDDAILRNAR